MSIAKKSVSILFILFSCLLSGCGRESLKEKGVNTVPEPVTTEENQISYEVYMSQYTLSTGYTMEIFRVDGMENKTLENKVNESLNSKLYILEGPWFSPENISENKPIIHYRTDRYLSVEYSFDYLAAYYQGTTTWHHCITVDMQNGEVVYFDDLIDLSEAFAKKVKYDSVLHVEGYSFWMEEDRTVLANRHIRGMETESILNAFQDFTSDFLYGDYYRENGYDMVYAYDTIAYQQSFYLEEGKICFTLPYDSKYDIAWIMLDDIEEYLKVPKWTECSSNARVEASVDEWQTMPDTEIEWIPELGYHGLHRISTYYSGPIICRKDVLSVGNAVYKREDEIYRKTGESAREWLGIADDIDIYGSYQWNDFLVFRHDGVIWDMDSGHVTTHSYDGRTYCVFQGKVYYREQDKGVFCMDLLSGEVQTIWAGAETGDFMVRDNGDMVVEVTKESDSGEWAELWLLSRGEQGDVDAEKIWQGENRESVMMAEFNGRGLFMWVYHDGAGSDFVCLAEDGKTEEIVREKWAGNNMIIVEEGYFLWDSSKLSEEEKVEILGDSGRSAKAATVVDSISYYDFQGNRLQTWRLIEDEMLEAGYRLIDIVYGKGEIIAFYENALSEDLYISKVQTYSNIH